MVVRKFGLISPKLFAVVILVCCITFFPWLKSKVLSGDSSFVWLSTEKLLPQSRQAYNNGRKNNSSHTNYTIDTAGCQIPYMDPFDPSVARYIVPAIHRICPEKTSITYEDGEWLRLNRSVIKDSYNNSISHCQYRTVFKPAHSDHNFMIGTKEVEFKDDFRCKDEFILVQCFDSNGNKTYSNFHMFIHAKDHVEQRCKKAFTEHVTKSDSDDKLSVLMVGIDSVSRGNAVRHLGKTRLFLQKHFETFEMKGYNNVAANTFDNLVPFLSGKYYKELPYPYPGGDDHFDRYNFIWKEFSQRGYRTQFVDENPYLAAFQLIKKGFHSPPTDYYAVSVLGVMYQSFLRKDKYPLCIGDRLRMDMLMKLSLTFAKRFSNKPYFSLIFTSDLTHDEVNMAGYADEVYVRYLTKLKEDQLQNNSVLLLFSDHGMRYGPIRDTFIGTLEASLPWMMLVFPKWFLKKYPQIKTNLRTNTQRLTTPFDIHETLANILYFNGRVEGRRNVNSRSISLFDEIPENRTCLVADIPVHWCTCKSLIQVNVQNRTIQAVAEAIMNTLNKQLLRAGNMCAHLELSAIRKAFIIKGYGQRESTKEPMHVFRVVLKTRPGNGVFDVSVKGYVHGDSFTIMDDLEFTRIDRYGDQSACIRDYSLRELCFCK